MKTNLRTVLIAAAAALALAACTAQPIYKVNDAAVTTPSGKSLSKSQVRQAIITAGTALGWQMVDAGPDKLVGTLRLRTHSAVVDIPYSSKQYSILFNSAENLDAKDGMIHRNYNGWVQNLDRQIRAELSRL